MLKELKFVQGAVAKKDFIPAITHFVIENGTVRAFNGTIALSSPIQCNLECKPKAGPMVQAIGRCEDIITLSMTPAGRLSIRSGSFKAFIECAPQETPHVEPEGERIDFNGEILLQAIKTIFPFVGNDASRPWTNGILLRDQSAFATNNVCLIEYWLGVDFPHVVNIPRAAIAEMIRINEAPTHAQLDTNSVTFHYEDGRWIRTQLFSTEWPDLAKVLDQKRDDSIVPIPELLFTGLETIKPFVDEFQRVFITAEHLRTHTQADEGAVFDIDLPVDDCIFNLEMLMLLKGVAKRAYMRELGPRPMLFFGERLRGAIIGMRL